jgi:GNAT superfamily N-acetyltransferase
LTEADLDAVQALMQRSRAYYELVTGAGPQPTAARDVWDALPPDTPRSAKLTLGVWSESALTGIVDVVRGWPQAGTWLIGLLLLDPAVRGRGVGARVVGVVDAAAASEGAAILRVSVVHANPAALAFWQRLAFTEVPATQPGAFALERAVTGG